MATANNNVGFHIKEEFRHWLEEHEVDFRISYTTENIDQWTQLWVPVIIFSNYDQAMLFKLTWL